MKIMRLCLCMLCMGSVLNGMVPPAPPSLGVPPSPPTLGPVPPAPKNLGGIPTPPPSLGVPPAPPSLGVPKPPASLTTPKGNPLQNLDADLRMLNFVIKNPRAQMPVAPQQGASLQKPAETSQAPAGLLAEIQKGFNLRKVTAQEKEEVKMPRCVRQQKGRARSTPELPKASLRDDGTPLSDQKKVKGNVSMQAELAAALAKRKKQV